MFQTAEVIETKKAYKPGQKDDNGMFLFNGSILVRVGGTETALGQVKNLWCAPATFNKRIPLIGEQVIIFVAPGVEDSATTYKTKRYYYFTPYNTINDLTLHQFPTLWNRKGGGKGTSPTGQVLADKKEVGYTTNKKVKTVKMLQPFEGDDIWEGRFGQSIRFTRGYGDVNSPGSGIYQRDAKKHYPSKRAYDPLMILKVKKPIAGNDYDLEDLSRDHSSIYLTTSQQLKKFIPGPKTKILCDIKEIPNWDKGAQILIDSDRVVINAKNDSAFLLGKNQSIVSAKKVILRTSKYHVDVDELMAWLKSLGKQINDLASAQATFTTFMGPTGVASNSAQILKIVKTDWAKYFNKGGCKGGIGSRDSGTANSTLRKNASNSLAGSSGAGGSSSASLLGSAAANALSSAAGLGGSASDQTPPGTPPATLTPEQLKAKGFVTTAEAGLATRNGKQFKSPISAELANRVKAFQNSLPAGAEQVITDTNDTGIHKSIAQNTGKSVDVNFKNFNPTPDKIATVITEGKRNGLKLEYEVATKEEAEAIYKAQPSLRGSGQVKVVKHITAPHFSVYMA